ncbi:hypothetical protein EIKCOROL_01783 [Eikenella corrodens ATCC 23834]|uniref:Uncharacterized protein n=1 Tax=Eikenella corrodens ATCC 23834 TaxID=546274 RepID=C0DWN1_EIKCO|nr:hypothetical protein EIKCOROL_01783 [Eikenella corrodens ATCC 23834]
MQINTRRPARPKVSGSLIATHTAPGALIRPSRYNSPFFPPRPP